MSQNSSIYVDLCFRLQGEQIPVDHGYHLFAAISHLLPAIHSNKSFAIRSINGAFVGERKMMLTPASRLTIRLPADEIPKVMGLAGKSLRIGQHSIRTGVPEIHMLQPSPRLLSRLVVIKGMMEADTFLNAAQQQLNHMGLSGTLSLPSKSGREEPIRRTLSIRDKEIVGFPILIENLSDEDSLLLQQQGIGGRRRFGCGVFSPIGRRD